ncbi:type VI secretion system FHA domain protein [Shinella sp. BE166]|uniref:FHA domain-containing protein n=1 Tax=Shinella lacus TaxID=2654216 RepID=A0ABT1R106_9HYPH|nr:FHA domain-containing protein [Shinella lacus]MCQ4628854.1 FHA domain-containing protein [Shinella lacus]
MRLVLKGPERLATGLRERTVETGALVIGRSEDADWVLADPERVVSKRHCRIERQAGGFLLTDMSTNGVLVNGVPLGREASRTLVDKDVLTLGDAIIAVAIETAAPGVAPLPVADDPFAEGPFGFDEQAAEAVKAAILPDTAAENARDKVAVLQDWWIPTADGRHGEPKPVDISGGMGNASIARTNAAGEAVASIADTGTNFAAEALGLDAAVFAKAVETAMLVLSVEEKRRFEGRLVELLRKEKSG